MKREYLHGATEAISQMNVIATAIPEVLIIEPKLFGDQRGFFLETYQVPTLCRARHRRVRSCRTICPAPAYGVLRGLHLQNPMTQGKLVTALRGRVLDVAVDVRVGSPNFGRHVAVELSEENRRQLWVPRGFAHGFVVLSEIADFFYKCDELYSPTTRSSCAGTIRRSDIDWGDRIPVRFGGAMPRRRCSPTCTSLPVYGQI